MSEAVRAGLGGVVRTVSGWEARVVSTRRDQGDLWVDSEITVDGPAELRVHFDDGGEARLAGPPERYDPQALIGLTRAQLTGRGMLPERR